MRRWLTLPLVMLTLCCNSIAGIDDLEIANAAGTAGASAQGGTSGGSGMGGTGEGGSGANGGTQSDAATPFACSVDQQATVREGASATLGATCSGGGDDRVFSWPDLGGWRQGDGTKAAESYISGDEYGVRTGELAIVSGDTRLSFNISVSVEQQYDDPGSVKRRPSQWWGSTAQTNWNSQPTTGDNTGAVAAEDAAYSANQASFAPGDFVAAQFDTQPESVVPDDAGDIRVSVSLRVLVCSAARPRLFARLINTAVQNAASALELKDVNCSGQWETVVATWDTNPFATGPWTPQAVNAALGAGWVVNPQGPGALGPDTVRVDYLVITIDYAR